MRGTELHWAEVRVGLFVAVAIVLAFGAVVYVGLAGTPFARREPVNAYFDDVSGLAEGSPVEMGGVQVGEVVGLSLPDVDTGKVRVVLGMQREALKVLGKSSLARVDSQAIVGQRYVGLTPRKPGEPPLEPGGTVQAQPARDIGPLLDGARDTLAQLDRVARDVQGLIDPLREAATALGDGRGTLGRLLRDDSLYAQLDEAAGLLRASAQRLGEGRGTLGTLLDDEKLAADVRTGLQAFSRTARELGEGRGLLGRLAADGPDTRRLDAALANLAAVSDSLAASKGTLGALINDPSMLGKLNRLVGEMDGLVADLRRNPSRYIKLQPF
jgi:phospholipid/cholesterol/gamma-HCH transport system substrate-binding protein